MSDDTDTSGMTDEELAEMPRPRPEMSAEQYAEALAALDRVISDAQGQRDWLTSTYPEYAGP